MRNAKRRLLAKGWQWRKLGDCAELINGRAYSQDELLDAGTPVLRIQNLNGGDRWYYSNLKLSDEKYCESGDLLYAWSASFGPYRYSGPKSIFHYHIWRVIPGEDLDKNFAFRLLEEITNEVKSAAHGVAMLHMTKGGMEAWLIPVPPLAEQRRIADMLDRAEALRAKRRAALAQLDFLTQSLFLDLFGDPATNPKGWPMTTLDELCRGITDIDHKMPVSVEEGIPFVSAKDLSDDGRISFEKVKRISEEDFRRLSRKSKPEKGDIIYSRIGVNLGKARMVEVDFDFLASYSCCTIKPNREFVDGTYLCSLLDSPFTLRQAHKGVRAIAVPDLGMGEIKAFKIIVPPIELQREFSRRVRAVEKLKTTQRASLAELDALFASLRYQAFSGGL